MRAGKKPWRKRNQGGHHPVSVELNCEKRPHALKIAYKRGIHTRVPIEHMRIVSGASSVAGTVIDTSEATSGQQ